MFETYNLHRVKESFSNRKKNDPQFNTELVHFIESQAPCTATIITQGISFPTTIFVEYGIGWYKAPGNVDMKLITLSPKELYLIAVQLYLK